MLDRAVNTLVSARDPVYSSLSQSSAGGKSSPQFPALSKASLPPEPRVLRCGPGPAGPPGAAPLLTTPDELPTLLPPRSPVAVPVPPPEPEIEGGLFHVSILPENAPTLAEPPCGSGFC